jgi:hypothetical protein
MRRVGIVCLVALAGCGGSGIEGTLRWEQPPTVSGHSVSGSVQNTTSHSVTLSAKSMRLLDDRGNKVRGTIRLDRSVVSPGDSTVLRATWKSGNPVRIDYGSGTLALPSA